MNANVSSTYIASPHSDLFHKDNGDDLLSTTRRVWSHVEKRWVRVGSYKEVGVNKLPEKYNLSEYRITNNETLVGK